MSDSGIASERRTVVRVDRRGLIFIVGGSGSQNSSAGGKGLGLRAREVARTRGRLLGSKILAARLRGFWVLVS